MDRQAYRSISSIWGSAPSNTTERVGRLDELSIPETKISINIDADKAEERMTGSSKVVCKTEAEYKANKLNRSEQTKLMRLKYRVVKEKELSQRQFKSMEIAFRAKSAKLIARARDSEEDAGRLRPTSLIQPPITARQKQVSKRPNSFPPIGSLSTKSNQGECKICAKIQKIIGLYESTGLKKIVDPTPTPAGHTTCMFSDVQVRTFIQMLEAKYFADVPNLNSKLKDSGILSHLDQTVPGQKMSKEEVNILMARKNVEMRIANFCKDLDKFNKENKAIPKEIKDAVERIRLDNAIVMARHTPTRMEQIKAEVMEMLNL